MPDMDLSLICGRRPGLLARTLESFGERLFRHVPVARVIVNIDPIFGDEQQGSETRDVARRAFPQAEVHMPETPGFCAAVQRNWAASTADYIFHLEDDWLLNEDITSDVFRHFDDATIGQVSLESREKKWNWETRGVYHTSRTKRRLFGIKLPIYRVIPFFTASPCFVEGGFARGSAKLMDPVYDPEKQFSAGVNKPLERFVANRRNRLIRAREGFLVTDIGRDWRADRGIEKTTANGLSNWSSAG